MPNEQTGSHFFLVVYVCKFLLNFSFLEFFNKTIYCCQVVLCTVSFQSWQTSWPDSIKELGCLQ